MHLNIKHDSYAFFLTGVTQRFLNTPKGKKTVIAARLNTSRQVENHNIETNTGLVRHSNF